MRKYSCILACVAFGTTASAQDDDPSYLEGLIQDALSGSSREVRVIGFDGALSSNATLEQLTIADDEGVWLSLEDASLVWTRTALLRGRLKIDELTAGRIELVRLPKSEAPPPTPEDAEAKPFALPELPVSIELGELRANHIELGPEVLGEPATLELLGRISLIEGTADVDLNLQSKNRSDQLALIAGYANDTKNLKIDLDFKEAAGGFVSRSSGIPGAPSLELTIKGDAPLSDFGAVIGLSTDDVERFGGTVGISSPEDAEPGAYQFNADLSGDVRPLLTEDMHKFFGDDTTLAVDGATQGDGGLLLNALDMSSGALSLNGNLALSADGLPVRFALDGRISGDDPVRLPTAAPATLVDDVSLAARFDANDGDGWSADITVYGLERDGMKVERATLNAEGQITAGDIRSVSADTTFRVTGLQHENAALSKAVGDAPEGRVTLTWEDGAPIDITRLDLRSGDASLQASAKVDGLADGFPITGQGVLAARDLSRFADIAGRPLAGEANLQVEGSGTPLSGAFDVTLAASTTDLVTGEARVDPMMKGRSTVDLAARRDETGITVEALTVRNDAITADASGQLSGAAGAMTLVAKLTDLSLVEPKLSGPADVDTEVKWQDGGALDLIRLNLAALDAKIAASGTVDTGNPDLPASGTLSLNAADISRLAELLGKPLTGAVDLKVEGSGAIKAVSVDGTVSLDARDLNLGIAQVDSIIGGTVDLDGTLAYGDGVPFVDALTLETKNLSMSADASAPGEPIRIVTRLTDMGLVTPGINGPASVTGTLSPRDNRGEAIDVDVKFEGPSGINATIVGEVLDVGQELGLAIKGSAPLELANSFMTPNSITGPLSFDLRLDGPPGLSALSGQANINNARMALPAANIAVTGLGGTITLSNGQVSPDISGSLGAGGEFRVTGPVTLSAPFNGDITVALNALGLRDPTLYETTVNGSVNVNGPLTGGALISGALALGRTELRVPSGGAGAAGAPEGIRHISEPAAVRRTRSRAGLIETAKKSGPGVAFPLDLTISAPAQIFVRGRGLDAELGGDLRLGGTTANVSASGVFELIRGRMDILTKRLDLTEGLIDLRGSLDPYLKFVAETTSNEYTINITLEGLVSEPEVTFSSSPDLPQEEVLAQLLFGRDFSDMSAFQAAQLVSAVATLSGRGSGGLQGRLRNQLGLANLDVTSNEDGATEVSAGAYISDNIYSEIVADSEGNNKINLNLDINPSLTVKGSAANDGNTGIGIFFERDY